MHGVDHRTRAEEQARLEERVRDEVEQAGDETADRLIEKLVPRIEKLKVGPYTAGDEVDYGPVVTKAAQQNILGLVESGIKQGAELVVDGRDFSLQGYEDGFFVGPHLFDRVTPEMDIYKKEILIANKKNILWTNTIRY